MPMIIGEIRRYLRDNNALRVSRSVRDLAYRALAAREEMNDGEISVKQIAEYLGENEQDVAEALEAISEPLSLYEPVCGENGDSLCLMDQIGDGGIAEENWLESIALNEAFKTLSEREKNIVGLRFYRGKTQTEIAEQIGISQAQVSRIERAALEKIKKKI